MPQKPRKKGMPELFPPRLFAPLARQSEVERKAAKSERRAARRAPWEPRLPEAPAVKAKPAAKPTAAAPAKATKLAASSSAKRKPANAAGPQSASPRPSFGKGPLATPDARDTFIPRDKRRRALSMAESRGRMMERGDRTWSTYAASALRAASMDSDHAYAYTHGFHTYPAKAHPASIAYLLRRVPEAAGIKSKPLVLDPFCGSGTVLVEARALAMPARGFDLNPLAVALASVKTTAATHAELERMVDRARAITNAVVAEGKQARRSGYQAPTHHHAEALSARHRNKLLAEWFAPHVRRELEALAARVDELATKHPASADVFRMVLSAILYKVSRRTSDTDPTPKEKQIGRGSVARLFLAKCDELSRSIAELPPRGDVQVRAHDARELAAVITPGSATHIITSPPYPGTYDYAHHHDLRFAFLGLPAGAFSTRELGSRRSFSKAPTTALQAWRADTKTVLTALSVALAPDGFVALIVGDSLAGGNAVFALDELPLLLPTSLVIVASASQERPKLGSAEGQAFGDRIKGEHIVILRHPAKA
ncbi:MAG: hypothetical protein IPL79_14290 [Myxococcales bacterium]|nr:hypothetical protein [Myxococcales bacterium]